MKGIVISLIVYVVSDFVLLHLFVMILNNTLI